MLSSLYRQLEWGLLGMWAAILISAFAFGQFNADRTRHDIRPLLMVTSALLVVMAALFWLGGAWKTRLAAFSLLIALGMSASFVGDLIQAEYIPIPQRVAFGILAFGSAHVLYIAAYLNAARALGLEGGAGQEMVVAGFLVLGLILWAVVARSPAAPPILGYGALGYTLLISAMTGLAVWLAVAEPRLRPLALGAVLFLASDAILSTQLFRKRTCFLMSDVVWVLYICGQALIVWSNLIASGVVAQSR